MFHVDVTAEDSRIIAIESNEPGFMDCMFGDNHSGKSWHKRLTMVQLALVVFTCLNPDGDEAFARCIDESDYAKVESLFVDCPKECRPMP